jgi:predicted  nucleic acid-binding Zn-ribbon protein
MNDFANEIIEEDSLKFCPHCGHEGHDDLCPVCNEKMASIDEEVEKLAEKEEQKDLTEDAGLDEVSLEEVAHKEDAMEEEADAE